MKIEHRWLEHRNLRQKWVVLSIGSPGEICPSSGVAGGQFKPNVLFSNFRHQMMQKDVKTTLIVFLGVLGPFGIHLLGKRDWV